MIEYSFAVIKEVAKRDWKSRVSLKRRYEIVSKELEMNKLSPYGLGRIKMEKELQKEYRKRINKWLKGYLEDENVNEECAFIYGLFDPITFEIKYLGKTINPKLRYKQHIREAVNKIGKDIKSEKNKWIESILKNKLFPTMGILETTNFLSYAKAENFWITHYKKMGYNITNKLGLKDGIFLQKVK